MAHLLHEMKSTRVPRRYVFFDTEAVRRRVNGGETQSWRCGVTAEVVWQSKEGQWGRPTWTDHDTPAGLWATVTAAARDDARTVVVAHNLAYDLRIADGFAMLDAYGWQIEKLVLSAGHVGFDAVSGRKRLVLIDSTTVLPQSIGQLGDWLDIGKPELPDDNDTPEVWLSRCRRDVEILMRAYLVVVDALRSRDLGCWARTGSGMAWNTMLRRHMNRKVLVHGDDELRDVERGAIYGGRSEAWRWGKLRGGGYTEWDYELAYANILSTEMLPAYYRDWCTGVSLRHITATMGKWRWLVHATVTTDAPTLPLVDEHGTFFPVGTFTGYWWDVELSMAALEGARVTVLGAHRYRGEPWLQTWAAWCMDLVADKDSGEARVLGAAAKHWTRSLVGRSAMRYGAWDEVGDAYVAGVSYMAMTDIDSGASGACFQAGGRRWETWRRAWWDGALPQLLSAVSAHCRVSLWEAMRAAGLDHVVYCDTDALIVDREGTQSLAAATARGELSGLRRKTVLSRLDIWAPRYVSAPGYTRMAGVPSRRVNVGEHRYRAETWERLPEALSSGHSDSVVVRPVVVQMTLDDWHRRHMAGGATEPYAVVDGARVTEATEATGA